MSRPLIIQVCPCGFNWHSWASEAKQIDLCPRCKAAKPRMALFQIPDFIRVGSKVHHTAIRNCIITSDIFVIHGQPYVSVDKSRSGVPVAELSAEGLQ